MTAADLKTWFPRWRDHETLFSWCSRYHRVAGASRSAETAVRLFGHPRAGVSHDVPGHLDALQVRTGATSGSPASVVWDRTPLGYYLRFRSKEFTERVIGRLRAGSGQQLKAEFGWLATRAGASHPLKACDECMAEDVLQHGSVCWRLVHQLPGVWVCPWHRSSLWVTSLKTAGLRRFDFLLPDDVPGADRQLLIDVEPPHGHVAQRLASCTAHLMSTPVAVDLVALSAAFRARLRERGYARANGSLDYRHISESFAAYSEHFEALPRGHAIHVAIGGIEARWRRLLAPTPASLHPLRFLVPMTWLFDSWADWTECYEASRRPLPVDDVAVESKTAQPDPDRRSFFSSLTAGSSVRAAARNAGVDVQTGITWALKAGIPVKRRPKQIDGSIRSSIQRQLRVGRPKEMVARDHDVSITTVTRILLSTPGLRDARQANVDHRRLGKARNAIQACIAGHVGIGRKELHLSLPADYAWLYRHDKSWLAEALSALPVKEGAQVHRVDWCSRDAALLRSLEELRRCNAVRSTWSSRAALARAVPDLRPHLRHLDRLPRTAALIGNLVPRTRSPRTPGLT